MYPETSRNFESNKTLAGVGALLAAIGSFIPFAGHIGIVHIIGIILLVIGMKGIADTYQDQTIYRHTLNGFIFNLIGTGTFIATFVLILSAIATGFLRLRLVVDAFGLFFAAIALIIGFVFFLLAAISYKRTFHTLAAKSGQPLLTAGGTMLVVGAALTVVFAGFFLLFVAWIIIAIGLFQIAPPTTSNTNAQIHSSSSAVNGTLADGKVKYCTFCGSPNKPEASFCTHCGRRIETAT